MATRIPFDEFVSHYDPASAAAFLEEGKGQRAEILLRFPREGWATMPLERYALGQDDPKESYGRWIEFATRNLGSMLGGAARKHLIYRRKDTGEWYFADKGAADVGEAWKRLRAGFVRAFELADRGEWDDIDDLGILGGATALRLKTLHVYFPNEILPICSTTHLGKFLEYLGVAEDPSGRREGIHLNRALLAELRRRPALAGWSTNALQRLLYDWYDPRETKTVVKIAPGEDARLWADCLAGGYICVGWDEVGDLREAESVEAFREQFAKHYAKGDRADPARLAKKARELWTLTELEPGDIVVANRGISRVLAIGEVVEPGYEWSADRKEYRHLVRVKWNTDYAQDVEPVKSWAVTTVAKVPATLYEKLLEKKGSPAGVKPVPVPTEGVFADMEAALERHGQVILYGPPGTGKTYTARRFAVHWLLRHAGHPDVAAVLAAPARFAEEERRLTAVRAARRAWWVVSNPKEWSWNTLFKQKREVFEERRLHKNYPLVQVGDLVIGYEANPTKRIVALARIRSPLGMHKGSKVPSIELEPVVRVEDGLDYDAIRADPVLRDSEPVKFNNQGTLFALTPEETTRVLGLLAERNPVVADQLDDGSGVAPLTWLTFHPSYSYEDFIEGFRPVAQGGGALTLRLEDGVFKRICREALARADERFLILIDEINRANVAKVFGEIITLLEKDKRGLVVTLPQSKESFEIPPNVYLVGTMNTADRSIKLLDAALRRRFAFIERMPEPALLEGISLGRLDLDELLEELNARVVRRFGREKQIGHSFFMSGPRAISDPEEIARRFRDEVLPLLQELCYADYAALADLLGDQIVDREAQTLNREWLAGDRLFEALEKAFAVAT